MSLCISTHRTYERTLNPRSGFKWSVSEETIRCIFPFDVASGNILTRLNSTLAAVSSLLAVVGFIVQFVGLRALHWSATIIQLGITLVMTGVRAWVRRGLASDPTTRATLEGHEVAWLTLYILSHQQDVDNTIPPPMSQSSANGVEQSHNAAPASTTISQHTDISYPGILHHRDNYHEFWDALTDVQLRNGDELIWELIMGYDAIRDQAVRPMQLQNDVVISKLSEVAGINPSDLFAFKQLCAPIDLETPLRVQLADKLDAGDEDALKVYAQIASIIPIDMEVSFAATAFISVVERVMKIFCNCRAVVWKSDGIQIAQHDPDIKPAARVGVDSLAWGFPVSARNISCSKTKTKQLFLKIRRPHEFSSLYDEADPDRWCLLEKDSIFGLISLWSYAVARKQSAIEKMNASLSRSSSPEIRNDLGGRGFGRIVGTSEQSILEDWLGMPASQVSFPDGTNTISKEDAFGRYHTKSPTWFLGMLLSPMAE